VGDFFGEVSLLDEGPRSANVLANEDSLLFKITAASFKHMVEEAPALATPFLYGLSRSVVSRLRSLTRRYQDSVHCMHLVSLYYEPKTRKRAGPVEPQA
jgi:CRP-like cAMP-binding protein